MIEVEHGVLAAVLQPVEPVNPSPRSQNVFEVSVSTEPSNVSMTPVNVNGRPWITCSGWMFVMNAVGRLGMTTTFCVAVSLQMPEEFCTRRLTR